MNSNYEKIRNAIFLGILSLIILLMYLVNTKRYKWILIAYSISYVLFIYLIYKQEIMNALIPQLIIMLLPIALIFDTIIQIFRKPKTIN